MILHLDEFYEKVNVLIKQLETNGNRSFANSLKDALSGFTPGEVLGAISVELRKLKRDKFRNYEQSLLSDLIRFLDNL